VVTESHFPLGFLAPKVVTPENRKEVGGIQATSDSDVSPLLGQMLTPHETEADQSIQRSQ
jgi:hypothetical protein